MKSYIKPQFEYVALTSEERYASGSAICDSYGSCPTDCESFAYDGTVIMRNFHAPI